MASPEPIEFSCVNACQPSSLNTHSHTHGNTRKRSKHRKSKTRVDHWLPSDDGVWMRLHSLTRRSLASPSNCAEAPTDANDQKRLSSFRFTIGTYDDGGNFEYTNSWRNAERINVDFRQPWKRNHFLFLIVRAQTSMNALLR